MPTVSNVDQSELHRFLVTLPVRSNFDFSSSSRFLIRKTLFLAATDGGSHLHYFFPAIPRNDFHPIETDLQWLLTNYAVWRARFTPAPAHPRCARYIRYGEPLIACYSCATHDSAVLCEQCYDADLHKDHNVVLETCTLRSGIVCDCGDPEKWTHPLCPNPSTSHSSPEQDMQQSDLIGPYLLSAIEVASDFAISVLCMADSQYIPRDLYAADAILANELESALNPELGGFATAELDDTDSKLLSNGSYTLIAYNDHSHHSRDTVQRVNLASLKLKMFASMVALRIESHGKAKVISSSDLSLLLERQKILSATGLATCIRSDRDDFYESICDEVLSWICEVADLEFVHNNSIIRDQICNILSSPWRLDLLAKPNPCQGYSHAWSKLDSTLMTHFPHRADLAQSFIGTRFQYLVFLELNMWKSIRLKLHVFYSTALIANFKYRPAFGAQYAEIYPQLADILINRDREPEYNVMSSFSRSLLTSLAVTLQIRSGQDLQRMLIVAYNYFSAENVLAHFDAAAPRSLSMRALKTRRWNQLMADICLILNPRNSSSPAPNVIGAMLSLISLFQGKATMTRAVDSHVEYENPDIVSFFHALPSIYGFAFVAAKSVCCIAYPSHSARRAAICDSIFGVVKQLVFLECEEHHDGMAEVTDTTPPSQKKFSRSFATELVEDYNIDTERVSLVHPLHSILSWLLDFAKFDSPQETRQVLHSALSAACQDSNVGPCTLASIFEYPVRTTALISQIKSGFWVRNGLSVKTQLQMYRSSSLEKLGYSRDMHLIQVCCNICDPEAVTFMILSRWKLFLNKDHDFGKSCYDPATTIYMLEECMSFFIHLLTGKYSSTDEADDRYAIEQEILHNLCFGPLSYSHLCSLIPDHIVENKQFEHVLQSMTTYTAPLSAANSGQLVLHESFMDRVDPYFYNYSVNHKEEAIALVKSRVHKRTNLAISQIVLEPSSSSQQFSGALCNVGNVSTSRLFVDHLIKVLKPGVLNTEETSDNLLETSLHLIHICATEQAIERAGAFYERFLENSVSEDTSLALIMMSMLQDSVYQVYHPKLRAIFATFAANHPELPDSFGVELLVFDVDFDNISDDSSLAGKKKALATKRRNKMLAKFKRQQITFSNNNACCAGDASDTEMKDEESDNAWMFPEHHCILCQNTMEDAGPFGLISYISYSTEFRNTPFDDKYWMMKAFSDGSSLDRAETASDIHSETWHSYMLQIKEKSAMGLGFSLEDQLDRKLVTLTCGHGMHYVCYLHHLRNIKSKLSQVTRHTPENSEHQEFLCPLCKSINNFFIPMMWQANNRKLVDLIAGPSDDSLLTIGTEFEGASAKVNAAVMRGVQQYIRDSSILTLNAVEALGPALLLSTSQPNSMWLVMMGVFDDAWQLCFPHSTGGDYSTLLINSIKSAETSLRGCESGDSVVDQLSNLNLINLRVASEFRDAVSWLRLSHGNDSGHTVHVKQLAQLNSLTGVGFCKSVISADFFEILVNTIPMPTEGVSFVSILLTCFWGHLLQSINIISAELVKHDFYFGKDYTMFDFPIIGSIDPGHARAARHIFQMVTSDLNTLQIDNDRFGAVFFTMLVKACTPFLRRAAMYVFVQCANTDGMPPFSLRDTIEADRLSSMLNISSIGKLLLEFTDRNGSSPAKSAIDAFLTYKLSLLSFDQPGYHASLEYPGIISLLELPVRLDYFFTKYYYLAAFNFPYLTIEDPAVCLLCGEVVDTQKSSPGSDNGQCWTHFSKECGHSVGIFLLPKDKTFLLLHKNGGSFYPLPYADSKGEVLAGSKIQYLIELRYKNFVRDVWLLRNVPNYITRTLDSAVDVGGWETL